MMSCENCINFIYDGIDCLEGHTADIFGLDDCDDWIYAGDK